MVIRYEDAPNDFGPAWQRYVEHGILPGSFGEALLCNDLRDAVLRADHTNMILIPQHIMWLWDNLPYRCWGTREAVYAWHKKGGAKTHMRLVAVNDR